MPKVESLPEAWRIVAPADYEEHMARVGQAQANAAHLARWAAALGDGSLIIPGAGPGQMFDYIAAEALGERDVIFTDINPDFRERLSARLQHLNRSHWRVLDDDIEASGITEPIACAALILVLENVDWRKAIESLELWRSQKVLIVQQENPASFNTSMTPGLALPGTMNMFREQVHPHLIDLEIVRAAMSEHGFDRERMETAIVRDNKRMHACWYRAR